MELQVSVEVGLESSITTPAQDSQRHRASEVMDVSRSRALLLARMNCRVRISTACTHRECLDPPF